uniref:Helicase ATP-binding domain-containing protein n=1 Tax=Chromulina nebulosa TaxID=96789 RepID=A0A7S0T145_9STRA|mmetsp:Transcript_958/g.840  ORF Transcript_958/g.840 Transcript_958/m.840 type:complete len:224 (+) Transcript_958:74-745(+)
MDDPYIYQLKLFEMAKKENLVVVLPTGSGKTRVATLLINHYLELSNKSEKHKRIIAFLAKTKTLVKQQFQYIKKHLSNEEYNIQEFTGLTYNTEGVHIDNWKEVDWKKIFIETNVLVMTPAILHDAFRRSVLQVSQFALIVIDECHHVRGNTPEMNVCIKLLSCPSIGNRPRILGLTASPKNSKKGTLEDAISELEYSMSSRVEILPDEEISKERPHKLPTCN